MYADNCILKMKSILITGSVRNKCCCIGSSPWREQQAGRNRFRATDDVQKTTYFYLNSTMIEIRLQYLSQASKGTMRKSSRNSKQGSKEALSNEMEAQEPETQKDKLHTSGKLKHGTDQQNPKRSFKIKKELDNDQGATRRKRSNLNDGSVDQRRSKRTPPASQHEDGGIWRYFEMNREKIIKETKTVSKPRLRQGCIFLVMVTASSLQELIFHSTVLFQSQRDFLKQLATTIVKNGNPYQKGDPLILKFPQNEQNQDTLELASFDKLEPKQFRKGLVLPAHVRKSGNKGCELSVPGCTDYKFLLNTGGTSIPSLKQIPVSLLQIDDEDKRIIVQPLSLKQKIMAQKANKKDSNGTAIFVGTVLVVKILKLVQNGIIVGFLEKIIGFILNDDLERPKSEYKVGQNLSARITYFYPRQPYSIFLSQKLVDLNLNNVEVERRQQSMMMEQQNIEEKENLNRLNQILLELRQRNENDRKNQKKNLKSIERLLKQNKFDIIEEIFTKIESVQGNLKDMGPTLLSISLYAAVIKKIADPNLQELRKFSLPQQIILFLVNAQDYIPIKENDSYLNAVKEVFNQINGFFEMGIEHQKTAFNQTRIIKSAQQDQKIVRFNPNCIVTTQVFRQILNHHEKGQLMSYGHKGISKTFSYYFFQKLSTLFFSKIFSKNLKKEEIKEMFQSIGLTFDVPKLIYWTMTPYVSQQKLKATFRTQCSELTNHERIFQGTFYEGVSAMCQAYQQKGIRVFLLVDQINMVAAAIRELQVHKLGINHQIKEKQRKLRMEQMNEKRLILKSENYFDLVIYNSSVNNEVLFSDEDYNIQQNAQIFKEINCRLNLIPDTRQDGSKVSQSRIFFPELAKSESMAWFLTDFLIFEIKKKFYGTIDRRKIYQIVKNELSDLVVTPLQIRLQIEQRTFLKENFLQQVKGAMQNLKKVIKAKFVQRHGHFLTKGNNLERLEAEGLLYLTLRALQSKRNPEENNNEQQEKPSKCSKILEDKIFQIFKFLQVPLQFKKDDQRFKLLNLNLDRHLFIGFSSKEELEKYLNSLKSFAKRQLILELGNKKIELKEIQEAVDSSFSHFFDYGKRFSGNCGYIGFTLLPIQSTTEIMEQKINLLTVLQNQYLLKFFKSIYHDNNGSAFGQMYEAALIKALTKSTDKITIFKDLLEFINPEQKIYEFQSLPSLGEHQKSTLRQSGEVERVKNIHNTFLNQFMKMQTQGYYLYKPKNWKPNSKSIDFVIQRVYFSFHGGIKQEKHHIYFFNTTCNDHGDQIESKIATFVQAYSFLNKNQKDYLAGREEPQHLVRVDTEFVLIGVPKTIEMLRAKVDNLDSWITEYLEEKKKQLLVAIKAMDITEFKFTTKNDQSKAFSLLQGIAMEEMEEKERLKKEKEEMRKGQKKTAKSKKYKNIIEQQNEDDLYN